MKYLSLFFVLCFCCVEEDYARIGGKQLVLKDCNGNGEKVFEPFEIEFNFISFHKSKNSVNIQMQKGFKAGTLSDGFYLLIKNFGPIYDEWKKNKETKFPLGDENLRANLSLLESCPHSYQNISAKKGFIIFKDLGEKQDERVGGNMKFDFYDEQNSQLIGESFEGEFSFKIRYYPPYQNFAK